MSNSERIFTIRGNSDRRMGFDRRQFSYTGHIPERRLDKERRRGLNRRG